MQIQARTDALRLAEQRKRIDQEIVGLLLTQAAQKAVLDSVQWPD